MSLVQVSANGNRHQGTKNLISSIIVILPAEAGFGRRLWKGRTPLAVMVGSDVEWVIMLSADPWFVLAVEGTSRSRVLAFSEEAWSGVVNTSVSNSSSCLETCRPVDRFPESGRGKVPIPLSNVLIWQQDSKTQEYSIMGYNSKMKGNRKHYGKDWTSA